MCASLQPFHSVSADRRRRIVAALAAADPVLADALVCAAEAGPDALAGMGEAELQASLTRAFKTSHGAAAWAERLRRAGIRGVTVLRSIHQLHREHSCADVAVPDGPTFQFVADDAHPVGGRVSMFAPCGVRVRGVDPGVVLPLTPAPRYGEHTTAVLAEVGVSSADLLARGAAAVCWSTQYLPGRAPQGTLAQPMLLSSGEDGPFTTAQRDRCTDSVVEKCPVCLGHSDRRVQLSCSHVLCSPCAQRCDAAGHQRCPICRHPHLLDPKLLGQRSAEWRRRYHGWCAMTTPLPRTICPPPHRADCTLSGCNAGAPGRSAGRLAKYLPSRRHARSNTSTTVTRALRATCCWHEPLQVRPPTAVPDVCQSQSNLLR